MESTTYSSDYTKFDQNTDITIWERWAYLLGRLLIFFAILFVPLIFHTATWRHFHLPKTSSLQFLMMLIVACWATLACKGRMVRSAVALPASFFFFIVMLTTMGASNLAEAWESVYYLAACLLLMVVIPKFFTRFKNFETFVYLIGLVCIFVDLYALAQKFQWDTNPDSRITAWLGIKLLTPKPVSFMGNENYAAEYLNMILPIGVMMMFCYRKRPAEFLFFTFITMLNIVVMTYIDCNASYAGFAVSIPIVLILLIYYRVAPWLAKSQIISSSRKYLQKNFRHIVILAILGLSIFATLVTSVPNKVRQKMVSLASWVDVNGDLIPDGMAPIVFRLQCMDAAMRNIKDDPIRGIGLGNFKVMHPQYESQLERKVLGKETLARKVHNDHLSYAVETGFFGLLGFYWVIAVAFFAILRSFVFLERMQIYIENNPNPNERKHLTNFTPYKLDFLFYLQLGIFGAFIVALVSCGFGHTFVIPSSAVIYWSLTGVCVAIYQYIYFVYNKIPKPVCGLTSEPRTAIHEITKIVPGIGWLGLFFALILPLGSLNTNQYVGETFLRLGMEYNDYKRKGDMLNAFDKAMDIYPYQMEIYYILGRYYIDIINDIERFLDTGEPLPSGISAEDDYEQRLRYIKEGIIVLQSDLYLNPNYKWAHNNLGVIYDRLSELVRDDPDRKELSLIASIAGQETYKRVLEIDEEQVYAHFNLGLGYMKNGDYEAAIDELNKTLVVDPNRTDVYKYLAQCYKYNSTKRKDDIQRSFAATNKLLEKTLIFDIIGNIHSAEQEKNFYKVVSGLQNNNYIDAIRYARLLFGWEDSEREVHNLYFLIAKEIADKPELKEEYKSIALEALQRSERIVEKPSAQEYFWYSMVYQNLGMLQEAVNKLAECNRIYPNDQDILHTMVKLYAQLEQNDLAEQAQKQLIQVSDDWAHLITYARIVIHNRKPISQVIPYLQKALELGGDEAKKYMLEDTPGNYIRKALPSSSELQQLIGTQ
jgi:tetratricopeptide (TPR) repeat protein/O-antigen ligase